MLYHFRPPGQFLYVLCLFYCQFVHHQRTLQDYFVSEEKVSFVPWNHIIDPFYYSPNESYHHLFVPTEETTKIEYIVDLLLRGGFHVLLTGETGRNIIFFKRIIC